MCIEETYIPVPSQPLPPRLEWHEESALKPQGETDKEVSVVLHELQGGYNVQDIGGDIKSRNHSLTRRSLSVLWEDKVVWLLLIHEFMQQKNSALNWDP